METGQICTKTLLHQGSFLREGSIFNEDTLARRVTFARRVNLHESKKNRKNTEKIKLKDKLI